MSETVAIESKVEESKPLLDELQSLLPEPDQEGRSRAWYWYDCDREIPDPDATQDEVAQEFLTWLSGFGRRTRDYIELMCREIDPDHIPDPDFVPTEETPFTDREIELLREYAWLDHLQALEQEQSHLPPEYAVRISTALSEAGMIPPGAILTRFKLGIRYREPWKRRPSHFLVELLHGHIIFPESEYPNVASHIPRELGTAFESYRIERRKGEYEGDPFDEISGSGNIEQDRLLILDLNRKLEELPIVCTEEIAAMEAEAAACQARMVDKYNELLVDKGDIAILEVVREIMKSDIMAMTDVN